MSGYGLLSYGISRLVRAADMDVLPIMRCPKCGHEEPDPDGFSMLHCSECGWCEHPAADKVDGVWICGICGSEI